MKIPEIFGILWTEIIVLFYLVFSNKYDDTTQKECFKHIGCFNCNVPFFDHYYRPTCTMPTRDLIIRYLLYTPKNPHKFYLLHWSNESLASSPFNASLPTKVLIPGFNTTLEVDPHFYKIKDEFLKSNPYNVIIVDWTDFDNFPYVKAIANGRRVGAATALLLKLIKENKKIDYSSFHLIGHSLGAHVSGWVGERLDKIGRITGLDPAGPFFHHAPKQVRLDRSDAKFVDIIHTNGGNNLIEGFGLLEAIGDVDFYVNGGNSQPKCGRSNIFNLLDTRTCAHSISLEYFENSINQCYFPSVSCDSYKDFKNRKCNCKNSIINEMGFHAREIHKKDEKSLQFYLHATASAPYGYKTSVCKATKDLNKQVGWNFYFTIELMSLILHLSREGLQFSHFWYSEFINSF